jgi:hypothetical protein
VAPEAAGLVTSVTWTTRLNADGSVVYAPPVTIETVVTPFVPFTAVTFKVAGTVNEPPSTVSRSFTA